MSIIDRFGRTYCDTIISTQYPSLTSLLQKMLCMLALSYSIEAANTAELEEESASK